MGCLVCKPLLHVFYTPCQSTFVPITGTVQALERVADRALQVAEAAVCNYRSHRSSQSKNAAILYHAVGAPTLTYCLCSHAQICM